MNESTFINQFSAACKPTLVSILNKPMILIPVAIIGICFLAVAIYLWRSIKKEEKEQKNV
jgi:hypothetical protein